MSLSVCMFTYNHESFIRQSVLSALSQVADFDFEVVVGEDCSTDETPLILNRMQREFGSRLRVNYNSANIGAQNNFLNTLADCRGDYIAFLDGDDYWTYEKKLALQVSFLERNPYASFCFHRTRSFDDTRPNSEYVLPADDPPDFVPFNFLLQDNNPVALHSVVARRSAVSHARPWLDGLKLGDWPLTIMMATRGPVGFIPQEMSRYRVHGGGSWTRLSSHLRVAYIIQMLLRISSLLDGDQKRVVGDRLRSITEWWSHDAICNESVNLKLLMTEIGLLGDDKLSNYFLLNVSTAARDIQSARVWCETQSQIRQRELECLSNRIEVAGGKLIRGWFGSKLD